MDRFWFLTWTTYGSWLPGDHRGFVSPVWNAEQHSLETHNEPGTDVQHSVRRLQRASEQRLRGKPVYLSLQQAEAVSVQLVETATIRSWRLLAYAIMRNHVHVALGVPGDPKPEYLIRDLKAYASRALNHHWSRPESGTWWTESGSKRKIEAREESIASVVRYIEQQETPWVCWS